MPRRDVPRGDAAAETATAIVPPGGAQAHGLRCADVHGGGVGPHHAVRVEQGAHAQCLEVPAPRSGEKGIDQRALAAALGGGRRLRALHLPAGAAGEVGTGAARPLWYRARHPA